MGLIDKIKNKVKKKGDEDQKNDSGDPDSALYQDYDENLREIMEASKISPNGNTILKVDMKKLTSKHVISLVKKNRSLDEQNKYLSKYL